MHDIMGSLTLNPIKIARRDGEQDHPHADILSDSKLGVNAFTYVNDSTRKPWVGLQFWHQL